MIPDDVLSTEVISAGFLFPRNTPRRPLVDYEYGGVDIQDGTRGLRVKVWKGEYIDGQIVLSAEGVAPVAVLTVAGVEEFQFTFDRNMNVFVAYQLSSGACRFYWFDSLVSNFVTTNLPSGTITPRCAHDDNRDLEVNTSDIILSYARNSNLYYREQRERYQTEHLLAEGVAPNGLVQIGLNRVLRFQFQLYPNV
jgi:hypothetical protein